MPCPIWLSQDRLPSTSGTQSGVPPAVADCRTHGSGTSSRQSLLLLHHELKQWETQPPLPRAPLQSPDSTFLNTDYIKASQTHPFFKQQLKISRRLSPFPAISLQNRHTQFHTPTNFPSAVCLIHVRHALNKVLGAPSKPETCEISNQDWRGT